jgi:4-hydroxybenzoate polyprenyltransferase
VGQFASIGRLHIVAIAALGAFTFGRIFTGELCWLATGLCALDWFLVNLLNRVVDIPEDTLNQIQGTSFVAAHRRAVLAAGFTVLALSALSHLVAPALTPWRAAYHALGAVYNWPLLGRRLKELYFVKNSASATGFLLTVFGYPLATHPLAVAPRVLAATIAFFFLFEVSYEVIYDLRDREGDARAGVRTYPVVHGERIAVRIIDVLLVVSSAILVGGWACGLVPWKIAVMAAAPAIQAVWYKRALRRGITSRDCIAITWTGAALLLAWNGWLELGLPGV